MTEKQKADFAIQTLRRIVYEPTEGMEHDGYYQILDIAKEALAVIDAKETDCTLCERRHAVPDCADRPDGSGPHCKFPKPEDGCSACWYGYGSHGGTDCDLELG